MPFNLEVKIEWNNNTYLITVETKDKKVKFNSLGELNCNTEVYTFELNKPPKGYSLDYIDATNWFNSEFLNL